jgi:hypothetical protein
MKDTRVPLGALGAHLESGEGFRVILNINEGNGDNAPSDKARFRLPRAGLGHIVSHRFKGSLG